MVETNKRCRVCNVELTNKNWYPSYRKKNNYVCKLCENARVRLWAKANPEKTKASDIRHKRKYGILPFAENKECSKFLGCHVAERVLSHVFKDVERMPFDYPGYDVVCNRDKKIDIKSACLNKHGAWGFNIKHNTIPDFFLCIAFNTIKDLTPLYVWLIPGNIVNHLSMSSIRPGTIHKWDAYRLDITKIVDCCDTIRNL